MRMPSACPTRRLLESVLRTLARRLVRRSVNSLLMGLAMRISVGFAGIYMPTRSIMSALTRE